LRIVSGEVQRLSRTVRSMLSLSRIEAGELSIKLEPVDITKLVVQTLFTFEQPLEQKNIEVRGLDTEKHFLDADSDMINQVVYNLIDNAVKFVNTGGYLEFSFTDENGKTLISVKNSGSGIEAEEIPKLFDRFYKSDRSRGLDKNGVGLGLYIVKTIIKIHNGDIFVRSRLGEYTEFVFSLPTSPFPKSGIFRKGPAKHHPPEEGTHIDAEYEELPETPDRGDS